MKAKTIHGFYSLIEESKAIKITKDGKIKKVVLPLKKIHNKNSKNQ